MKTLPDKRTLIIFTGGPGTGKSGTADRFLQYLNNDEIIKISYDKIKEKNWDTFGFENDRQKDRINQWSLEEFYLTIQKQMWKNRMILIEYPFYQRHKPKLEELINESGYSVVTIYLFSDMETVYERGVKRDKIDDRHPGHLLSKYHIETYTSELKNEILLSRPTLEEFVSAIAHKEYNIKLGLVIPIDVTDFNKISYDEIYKEIVKYQKERIASK
ncbi:MAG: zeta toxin family protein [Lachnospiraceae bacterium]